MATNPLAMSDEDFMNLSGPAETAGADPVVEQEEEEDEGGELDPGHDDADEGEGGQSEEEDGDDASGSDDTADNGDDADGEADKAKDTEGKDQKQSEPKADKDGKDTEPKEEPASEPDYKAFYQQIMTPFRANGKTIELKDPAEAIQLMQMGANYTKKLQDIQPHRKVLLMLQNNDLLDEGKLSYLIDLDKKNPEAIKKLVKDAGIDPLDIDTSSDPDYVAGTHKVTDDEARFLDALTDITSSDTGKQTIATINSTWDQASKEVIWAQPEIMSVIHEQRESGVYALIVAEMDRQKMLGKIPPSAPFLQAYKQVGDALAQAGAFGSVSQQQGNPGTPEPRKIAERPAAPKPKVANGDKAKSAGTARGSSNSAKPPIVNPLAMSDEEFMKMDNLRNRL